jgi:hypothetical protein
MTNTPVPWIPAEEVFARVGFDAAIRVLQRALKDGLDPARDFDRCAKRAT